MFRGQRAVAEVIVCPGGRQRGDDLAAEQFGLLGGELGVGQDSLLVELSELLQLSIHINGCRGRGRWGLRRLRVSKTLVVSGLLGCGVLFLLVEPLVCLPPTDTASNRCRGSGNDRGPSDCSNESSSSATHHDLTPVSVVVVMDIT